MRTLLIFIFLLIVKAFNVYAVELPAWFTKSFNSQKLNISYKIIKSNKPLFLEADFNGDNKMDVAVQVLNIKTKKTGILIINRGRSGYYILGAGKKFFGEDYDDTKWLNGWKLFNNKYAYRTSFNHNGDMIGSTKIRLEHPAIYIYSLEDGDDIAGELIFWKNNSYTSIHQGE